MTDFAGLYALERGKWPPGASLDDANIHLLHQASHDNPSYVLGCHKITHEGNNFLVIRAWHPRLERDWGAEGGQVLLQLDAVDGDSAKAQVANIPMIRRCAWLYEAVVPFLPGVYEEARGCPLRRQANYRIKLPDGTELVDAWAFGGDLLTEEQCDQFQGGCFVAIADAMGSHAVVIDGVHGVRFLVWAPRAKAVSVVGDWNSWDGRWLQMRRRHRHVGGGFTGIWELFVPFGCSRACVPLGNYYGYQIIAGHGGMMVRTDPFAQEFEVPPTDLSAAPAVNSSRLSACDDAFRPDPFAWGDKGWLQRRDELRTNGALLEQPMAIYEVHLPSWRRTETGGFLNYRDLAPLLVEHMKNLHFNYVELIGLAHHPYTGSWGYQVSGYYGCYSLLGSPDDFKFFVNALHQADIGVIMDFVPAHFCKDGCSFAHYDGTPCFEYEDPREGEQRDWGTKVFNFRRNEVRSFLIGAAVFWAHRYHIDGFRCDAVSSMLYRNFDSRVGSKKDGEWVPNEHGGVDNQEAVSFLRALNRVMKATHPGVIMIAEESHAWGGVTAEDASEHSGWLGFDLKWDLGWMNDTLEYMKKAGSNKRYHHANLTRRQLRIERWVCPLSHDEVSNRKGSLLDQMGREEGMHFYDRLRLLAALYGYQCASIGRPLLFMGQEIAMGREWDGRSSLDWHEGGEELRSKLCTWLSDLLAVYNYHKPLHAGDDGRGIGKTDSFEWVESNADACVLAFVRAWRRERPVLVICNFGNHQHHNYGMSVPYYGEYEVMLNSDDLRYGGRGCGPPNLCRLRTSFGGCAGWNDSMWLDLPAQSCLLLLGPENPMGCKSGGMKRLDLTGRTWMPHGQCDVRETTDEMYINEAAGFGFDGPWMGM